MYFQVANVQRFKLMEDMDLLLTWIHCGTWLDRKFVWGPQIRSPVQSEITFTFSEIKEAVLKATEVTERCKDIMMSGNSKGKIFLSRTPVEGKKLVFDFMFVDKIQQVKQNLDNQNSSLTHFTYDSEDPFDPDVPNVEVLPVLGQETNETAYEDQSSDESSDEEDNSIFL